MRWTKEAAGVGVSTYSQNPHKMFWIGTTPFICLLFPPRFRRNIFKMNCGVLEGISFQQMESALQWESVLQAKALAVCETCKITLASNGLKTNLAKFLGSQTAWRALNSDIVTSSLVKECRDLVHSTSYYDLGMWWRGNDRCWKRLRSWYLKGLIEFSSLCSSALTWLERSTIPLGQEVPIPLLPYLKIFKQICSGDGYGKI